MIYWLGYLAVLMIGLAILLAPFFILRYTGKRPLKTLIQNISLSLVMFFLTLMVIELYFKVFFAQSDGFGYTLANQNWRERYWRENSLGYRDVEWSPENLAGKTKVMVVGDSFVAGYGIANPEDRFANRLGRLLGDNYAVLNVSSGGWDTLDEVKAIIEYPYKPDIIVLSYYVNDIEGAAYETGVQRPSIRYDPSPWLFPWVQNSYAFNFLYWRVVRLGPQEWAAAYWTWLRQLVNDPDIRWRHQQELLTIANGAAAEHIPLVVVVFPNLAAIDESQFITQPVINLFQECGVPVLDVGALLAGRNPAEITVNAIDAHPNETVNLIVAEQLYQLIRAEQANKQN